MADGWWLMSKRADGALRKVIDYLLFGKRVRRLRKTCIHRRDWFFCCFPLIPLKKRDLQENGKQQTQALRGTNERQKICVLRVFSSILVKSERKLFLFCPLSRKEIIFSSANSAPCGDSKNSTCLTLPCRGFFCGISNPLLDPWGGIFLYHERGGANHKGFSGPRVYMPQNRSCS